MPAVASAAGLSAAQKDETDTVPQLPVCRPRHPTQLAVMTPRWPTDFPPLSSDCPLTPGRHAARSDRSHITELLRSRGDGDRVVTAEPLLPHEVDTDRDGEKLSSLGVDVDHLLVGLGRAASKK